VTRRFLLLVAALALPAALFAQQTVPVIGFLGAESPEVFATRLAAFRQGLGEVNYAEGRNVAIEYRWAEGDNSRLPQLAAELVGRKVSVIVAPGSIAAALAAKKATATIPIVFLTGLDPVASGLVHSMNRPGGNATGITSLTTEMGPKRLQLLRELVPGLKSFALLVNPTNPEGADAIIDDLQVAAHAQRLQFKVVRAANQQDLAPIIENLARQRVGGLVIASDTFFVNRSQELGALTLRYKIAAIHTPPEFVTAGGLVSYAGSFEESHRLAGVYTGRVLRGEKPADLPVQRMSKMQLYVNARTAKALGLVVPQSILLRADKVIE
jgi:putative ABC transport system substrate-binding protein